MAEKGKINRSITDYGFRCFGDRLKTIREKAKLSQEKLAEELGVSKGALCYYERGQRVPDIAFLEKVSQYFDIPYDYFMGLSDATKTINDYDTTRTGLSEETIDFLAENYTKDDECIIMLDKMIKKGGLLKAMELISKCSRINHPDDSYTTALGGTWGDRKNAKLYRSPSFCAIIAEDMIIQDITECINDSRAELSQTLSSRRLSIRDIDNFVKELEDEEKCIEKETDDSCQTENKVRQKALDNLKKAGD